MSAYDITEFLRTAYRPFAYCIPSKTPLNTAYQKEGGVSPSYGGFRTTPHEWSWTQRTKNAKNAALTYLKAGSHYERLFQRWPAFEKSNKWAQTSAKLRSREGYFSFTLRTLKNISGAIQLLRTFPGVWLRFTAFVSAWQRLPALYLFSLSVGKLLPTQM